MVQAELSRCLKRVVRWVADPGKEKISRKGEKSEQERVRESARYLSLHLFFYVNGAR